MRNITGIKKPLYGSLVAAMLCAACQVHAADAQAVHVCETDAQMALVSEPKPLNLRHYANGNVVVAVVDDGRDDVATALSLLIVAPPLGPTGLRQCRLVSMTDAAGYAALVLDRAHASYDPSKGLTVVVPAIAMAMPEDTAIKIDLSVTINQATGQITPKQTLSAE